MSLWSVKVGDRVVVRAYNGRVVGFEKVAKVGARQITLADGTRWTLTGKPWGGSGAFAQRIHLPHAQSQA